MGGFRKVLDRWRLTFIGVPVLTVLAIVVEGRRGLVVFVLSLLPLAFCDTMIARERQSEPS